MPKKNEEKPKKVSTPPRKAIQKATVAAVSTPPPAAASTANRMTLLQKLVPYFPEAKGDADALTCTVHDLPLYNCFQVNYKDRRMGSESISLYFENMKFGINGTPLGCGVNRFMLSLSTDSYKHTMLRHVLHAILEDDEMWTKFVQCLLHKAQAVDVELVAVIFCMRTMECLGSTSTAKDIIFTLHPGGPEPYVLKYKSIAIPVSQVRGDSLKAALREKFRSGIECDERRQAQLAAHIDLLRINVTRLTGF